MLSEMISGREPKCYSIWWKCCKWGHLHAYVAWLHQCSGQESGCWQWPASYPYLGQQNAFNALKHEQLVEALSTGCGIVLPQGPNSQSAPNASPQPHYWDILWPFIKAHYCCHGTLRFFHSRAIGLHFSQKGLECSREIPLAAPFLPGWSMLMILSTFT